MIPIKCFSCGKPVSHLWPDYVALVKEYEEQDRAAKAAGTSGEGPKQTPIARALKELGLEPERYCCRRMLMCNVDLSDDIS